MSEKEKQKEDLFSYIKNHKLFTIYTIFFWCYVLFVFYYKESILIPRSPNYYLILNILINLLIFFVILIIPIWYTDWRRYDKKLEEEHKKERETK